MQCETTNSHVKSFLSTKTLFSKISFFPKFCLILFYFINYFFRKNFVMNSVHEQCPIGDSETVLSPNIGSKTGWVHQEYSVHSHNPACARAWPCRGAPSAVSWRRQHRVVAWPLGRVAGLAAVSWHAGGRVVALNRAVSRHKACSLAPFLVTIHLGVLQYKLSHSIHCCHDTMTCITTQFFPQPASLSITIQPVYFDTLPSPALQPQSQYTLVYCNTISQLTSPSYVTIQWCIVILTQPLKPTMSQYNDCIVTHSPATQAAAYCNTISTHKAMSQYNFIGQ